MNRQLSTGELVVALAETGMSARRIIEASGLPSRRAYRWIDEAWRDGRDVQPRRPRRGVIVLSGDLTTRTRLQDAAHERGLSEVQLINLILGQVAADDLFNAILVGAY